MYSWEHDPQAGSSFIDLQLFEWWDLDRRLLPASEKMLYSSRHMGDLQTGIALQGS